MRTRFALAIALALSAPLPGCTALQSPVKTANHTTADERAAIALELAYTSASRAGASLVRAGIIDPAHFRELDGKAYAALSAARAAYAAGNASDYAAAVAKVQEAVTAINLMLGKVA